MVIAVENNGTRELLDKDSIYGKLIENSKDELKNELYYFLINDEERKKYEIKGFERAKNYDKNIIKVEIERFIDEL